MSFRPPFVVGSTVTHPEICTAFQCGNMGGMRHSKRTNTLIIISDHTKALYDDKWYGDTLHYTGEGKRGDQTLTKNNRTLNESDHNGVEVHLFEVLHPTQYIYHGVVSLAGKPNQEDQADEDGVMRKVWMFPVKPAFPISVDSAAYQFYTKAQQKRAEKLSDEALARHLNDTEKQKAAQRDVTSSVYVRNPYVAEYAKRRAKGICQLCGQPAPFCDQKGRPYLESHHIEWLSQGGADTTSNTAALCPNCHKKMHIVNDPKDVQKLRAAII